MAKKRNTVQLVTPVGTAAFAWLSEPDTGYEYSDGKFKVTLVLDPEDEGVSEFIERVDQEAKKLAVAEWGKMPKNFMEPLRAGSEKREEWDGLFFLNAKSKFQPGCVDANKVRLEDDQFPRSGDRVRLSIQMFPYKSGRNVGVSSLLRAVQLIERRTDGIGDPEDEFGDEFATADQGDQDDDMPF